MNNKNIIAGAAVVLAVVFGVSFLKQTQVVVQTQGSPNEVVQVGASPGPDRSNARECVNGLCQSFRSETFRTSTSTASVVKNPSASSTPEVIITITSATSTAYTLVLSENTVQFARPEASATSSGSQGGHRRLAEWVVPANTTPTLRFVATSTTSSSDNDRSIVASPNSWYVIFLDDGGLRFPEGVSSTGVSGKVKVKYTEF